MARTKKNQTEPLSPVATSEIADSLSPLGKPSITLPIDSENSSQPQPPVVNPQFISPEPEASSAGKGSITVKLTEDGALDMDSMRDATKEKLNAALSKTKLLPAKAAAANFFTKDHVAALLGFLGSIEATLIGRKFPGVDCDAIFRYDDVDVEILAPSAIRILNKRVGNQLGEYSDEVILGLLLLNLNRQKFAALQREFDRVKQSGRSNERDR